MDFFDVINLYGLCFAAALAFPYILWSRLRGELYSPCPNQGMLVLDRIGRFGSLFLMSVHLGALERGFTEPKELMRRFWLISAAALTVIYLLFWLGMFRRKSKGFALGFTVSGTAVVMLSGLLQVNVLLLTFGAVYLIGDIYLIHNSFKE